MASNPYIVLDGKKYATVAKNWQPQTQKPQTARQTLNGDLDVTYGKKGIKAYSGEIVARVAESGERLAAGYGTSSDIETALDKMAGVAFTDHEGNSVTAHVAAWRKRSLTPNWRGSSNKLYYEVKLIYA